MTNQYVAQRVLAAKYGRITTLVLMTLAAIWAPMIGLTGLCAATVSGRSDPRSQQSGLVAEFLFPALILAALAQPRSFQQLLQ